MLKTFLIRVFFAIILNYIYSFLKKIVLKKKILYIGKTIIAIIFIVYLISHIESCTEPEIVNYSDTSITEPVKVFLYGINIDSFEIVEGKIKNNQNITSLLLSYNIPRKIIDEIVINSDTIFDLRKIRAGNKYTVFYTKDSIPETKYFVYEHNAIEYVLFDLNDTVIKKLEKEVLIRQTAVCGIIHSSLWNSMYDKKINPMVAIELSEIFAWTIDFFGLQKGDNFKIVFDEQYVDSTSIGISKIHTAYFYHANKDYFAIPFIQDSTEAFYDETGKNLKKAFLKAPLKYSRISSRFSNSRLHPVLKIRRPHHGVDYAAPVGTPVVAIGDGKVIETGYKGGAGNMIKIKHNSNYTTAYLHLSKYGKGIKSGVHVSQGEVIGYVGSTGLSSGPHLDYRVYKNGNAIDPLKMESPPSEPINNINLAQFNILKDSLINILSKIKIE